MLEEDIKLNDKQQDVLKEIANICAGNAATAFSQLLNKKIEMNVPRVHLLRVEKVPEVVGGADTLVVSVVFQVFGDAPGVILLLFPQKDARSLAAMLTETTVDSNIFTEMDQSAIKEAGSILTGAYLNTLSSFTRLGLIPSTPSIVIDMAGALVDYILIELATVTEYALLIDSEFIEEDRSVRGHFFLLPNPGSLTAILKAIGA
ncbi:MAG: chemotaxis protein CheC [Candidatus Omnitrophica bacterium]|nr:chemotaxis protein CheC [Candidatus Omnitrophota bacterium]MBU4479498.1 chemotaxis protein CheC [Candidatus Omnitrophota bacterium]MCG2702993.1 chemotaxis protein CheC [Candidatus Omnitrophota bacterium]